jgi:hypothetical protein
LVRNEKDVGKAIDRTGNEHGSGTRQVTGNHRGRSGVDDRGFSANQSGNGEWGPDQKNQLNVEPMLV